MAGYIEWSKGLAEKREVLVMASRLKRDPNEIAGRLMRFWEWCDDNIPEEAIDKESGDAVIVLSPNRGDTDLFIDTKCGLNGIAKALAADGVEWLKHERSGRVRLVHYGRHNGATAKTRARNARNQANRREKAVTNQSPFSGDNKVTNQPNPTLNGDGSVVRSLEDMEGGAGGIPAEVEFDCLDEFADAHLSQPVSLCIFHRRASAEHPDAVPPTEPGLLWIIALAVHAVRDAKKSKVGLFGHMVRRPSTSMLNGNDRREAKAILKSYRAAIAAGEVVPREAIPICDETPA